MWSRRPHRWWLPDCYSFPWAGRPYLWGILQLGIDICLVEFWSNLGFDCTKGVMLQFISFTMVSFSFLFYVALVCSLVCILTTGYILWFFWVRWTLLSSSFNPRRSFSVTTGRDVTCWLIFDYAYLGQLSLPSDSLVSDTYSLLLIDSSLFYGVLRLRVS